MKSKIEQPKEYGSIRSQANVMMLGECLCMLVYVIYWWAGELNLVCLRPSFLYAFSINELICSYLSIEGGLEKKPVAKRDTEHNGEVFSCLQISI